jgi:ribosomal protein S18 acetylase RimI-like enzyme
MQTPEIALRAAQNEDREFIERVYFETQRWITEALFGRRGDDFERAKFAESYDANNTRVIVVAGADAGWLTVQRSTAIHLESIYLTPGKQRIGIGTALIRGLIEEARAAGKTLKLSTAKINPARNLYERLGFVVVSEDEYKVYMKCRP